MTSAQADLFHYQSPRDRANAEQRAASDPTISTFVAASAGSGKTKLLTDRLLRLMLTGAAPERILCLTFTKAAAAEMALRLQRILGRWVSFDDPPLDAAVNELGLHPTPELRNKARALFARVLDLPGGMRIGTIHAFCQSLLRRFPLEAAISPHFSLMDDRDAAEALLEAQETIFASGTDERRAAIDLIAGVISVGQFGGYLEAVRADRQRLAAALALPDLAAAQRRALGIPAGTEADFIAASVAWAGENELRSAARIVLEIGAKSCAERARRLLDWLACDTAGRAGRWHDWCGEFITDLNEPRAANAFVSKSVTAKHPNLVEVFHTECERLLSLMDSIRGIAAANLSSALLTLATPVLRAYAAHKQDRSLVDYDDLIGRTGALLVDPGAAWVLYKLDGGLDHLLLDEVQDTAPAQWQIAHAITDEFFSGSGARESLLRTVFAVGDRKQSIYSFQGADTHEFDRSREKLERRVRSAGYGFRNTLLDVSFRSTTPVLALVDAVFAEPAAAAGVVTPGQTLKHHVNRTGVAGAVELWPLAPLPETPEPGAWAAAEANHSQRSAPQLLAEKLADWIHEQTSGSVLLESRGRPLMPGDVLVLVRRRNSFAAALVRALKMRNVPVAGLDRMLLTEQAAVQDLLALADALLLPQDDLTFACFLTSPLGGLYDDDLLAFAPTRGAMTLVEAFRSRAHERPHWQLAWDFFSTLLSRVDFVTPYALLSEALGALGGRARLLGRLGPEAEEPVNELLNAALSYCRLHPPSLQGFLFWLRQSGAEIKREADATGNQVRVMTVHGAKGLQAPLVILPDTTAIPPDELAVIWAADPQSRVAVPLFAPRKEYRSKVVEQIRAEQTRLKMEEHNRLLYVALTRAEDRLVVCGWQTRRGLPNACWYRLVAGGFARLPAVQEPFALWDGDRLRFAVLQSVPVQAPAAAPAPAQVAPPAWLGRAPVWESIPPKAEDSLQRLAPSRPEGVVFGVLPPTVSPLADRQPQGRFRRGQALHALLQHLPALPASEQEAAAIRWLERSGFNESSGQAGMLADEALQIIRHPAFAPVFGVGSRAEVPLTGRIGNLVIGGLVDRLVVLPDRVLLVDYKTNRTAPVRVEDTPGTYLRQMAAYRTVVQSLFPGKAVQCALVWTRSAALAVLPEDLLDAQGPGMTALPAGQLTLSAPDTTSATAMNG